MNRNRSKLVESLCHVAAAVSLLTVVSLPLARAAGSANPAGAGASAPVAPASAPISPHARAARERALAHPEAAASGVRVSPFTDHRKPHKPMSGR